MKAEVAAKRFAVIAIDTCGLAIIALILSLGMPRVAYAYVDPSVMTYTIQAVAGVAVALSAVAGVAFRRTRKALFKALMIDENANKLVDGEVHRLEADTANMSKGADGFSSAAADKTPSKKRSSKEALSWPARFARALLVSVFCWLTVLVVAPFETVAGARGDLIFGLEDIWSLFLLASLGCAVAMALVMSLFRGKAFSIVLVLAFGLGLCCYLQAMFMNAGMPYADGRAVDWWGDHGTMMVVSLVVWIAVVVAIVVLTYIKGHAGRAAAVVLSAFLIIVQGIGVGSLFLSPSPDAEHGPHAPDAVTETGLFELSPTNNVVLFILDYYDTRTLMDVAASDPSVLGEMEGFTWYQDSAGVMIPTGFALPYLMTAQTPAVGQDVSDFVANRYSNSTYLEDLHNTGYSIGVYTTTFGKEYLPGKEANKEIFSNLDNAHALGRPHINSFGALKSLLKAALYRDMPWIAKPRFRFYSDDVNKDSVIFNVEDSPDETLYIMDDAKYFARLKHFGLSIDDEAKQGTFRMIHLNGDHHPFTINEFGEFVGEGNATKQDQAVGSMLMASTYLKEMKRLGVYDGATIIITADHGDWRASMDMPTEISSPIMLVKEPHAGHDPIKVSHAPVSHKDVFPTILSAMGADASQYGSVISDVDESAPRQRDFYYITHDNGSNIRSLLGYTIDGDVLDFNNWHFTGEVWPCNYANH